MTDGPDEVYAEGAMASHPLAGISGVDLWEAMKELDEIPGEWTFQAFSNRFLMQATSRGHMFWEPILDIEGLFNILMGRHLLIGYEPKVDYPPAINMIVDLFSGCFGAVGGKLTLPHDDEIFVGSHSVAALHMIGQQEGVYFQNWWGGWGDDEECETIGAEYLKRHFVEGWSLRVHDLGPRPEAVRVGADGRFAKSWMRPGVEELTRVDGIPAVKRRLASLFHPNREVIQLVFLEDDFPVGWAHVREVRPGDWFIDELFVIPERRGLGLASALLRWIRGELLGRAGVRRLAIVQLEADAVWSELNGAPHLPAGLVGLPWQPSSKRIWRKWAQLPYGFTARLFRRQPPQWSSDRHRGGLTR